MPYVADKQNRAKAAALVVVLHVALGFALVLGLAGDRVRHVVEGLATFDVREAPPPAELPPPPRAQPEAAQDEAGTPDLRATPAPVVAPDPALRLPVPSPVPTSDERTPIAGADASAGAAAVPGAGRGAGGAGSGLGGGGTGAAGTGQGGGLGSPARLVGGNRARLPSSFLRALGIPRGQASLLLTIAPTGQVLDCRVTAGSGSAELDGELCRIMLNQSRWEPARDRSGRPVTVQVGYTSTWNR